MNDWRRWVGRLVVVAGLCLLAWWVSRAPDSAYSKITGEAFATHYRITYATGPDTDAVQQAIDAELARIDALASTWRDDSELMRYNRASDPDAFAFTDELAALIQRAEQIEQQTNNAFSLRPDAGLIDLSAIAKGYAVDRVTQLLQDKFGITDCLVDIGGEVRAVGDGPAGGGWRVGIYLPAALAELDAPVLQLENESVATSGRTFMPDHILDPATGQPVRNRLASASVIHPDCATADALATALYVMGPDRGMQWAELHGVHVIFLYNDGTTREHSPQPD